MLVSISVSFSGQASHILGGEIRAEVVSCQSLRYKITIIGYADSESEVEFGNGLLDLGFGEPVELNVYTDFKQKNTPVSSSVVATTFEIERTFPGPGTYVINFREFNRNAEVINIPHAVNTPFYLETALVIDPLACNSAPVLSGEPIFSTYSGSRYEVRLDATDLDGDSLSAALITPREEVGHEVIGYQLPINYDLGLLDNPTASDGQGRPSLTVSPEALVWDAPNLKGVFSLVIQINEWRKVEGEWVSLGYVTRDMVVEVVDTVGESSIPDLLVTEAEDLLNEPDVYVYPNPTTGPISLEVRDNIWQGGTATMYNLIGEALSQRTIALGSNAYDITTFSSGFYFLNLSKGELQKTLRFVKR